MCTVLTGNNTACKFVKEFEYKKVGMYEYNYSEIIIDTIYFLEKLFVLFILRKKKDCAISFHKFQYVFRNENKSLVMNT